MKFVIKDLWNEAVSIYGPIKSCNMTLCENNGALLRVKIYDDMSHHFIVTGKPADNRQRIIEGDFTTALNLFEKLTNT